MNIYTELYQCLAVNHNFHNFVKIDEAIWQGWCIQLEKDVEYLPELIKVINNGQLSDVMGKSISPSLQDVKKLLKPIKRLANLDNNASNRLGFTHIPTDKQIVAELIETSKESPPGYWDDYDKVKHRAEGRDYMDKYIARKAGQ
jgi:hypothetical protein